MPTWHHVQLPVSMPQITKTFKVENLSWFVDFRMQFHQYTQYASIVRAMILHALRIVESQFNHDAFQFEYAFLAPSQVTREFTRAHSNFQYLWWRYTKCFSSDRKHWLCSLTWNAVIAQTEKFNDCTVDTTKFIRFWYIFWVINDLSTGTLEFFTYGCIHCRIFSLGVRVSSYIPMVL